MKSNRQIGLDGKIFVSGCLRRGSPFVFLLMIGGLISAFADILKLTGATGSQLDALTKNVFLYDLVSSLLLVAIMFYAYFLECGTSVPVFKHKPIVWFGFFRIGYHLLLLYYVGQRAFFSMTNSSVPVSLAAFYTLYMCWLVALIMANCYMFSILIKNSIRRHYEKEFKYLAWFGLGVQGLLFIVYIIAALTMKNVGDMFFGRHFCEFLRFCLYPLLSSGLWLIFLKSIDEVEMVFSQVDSALRERRYQIAYSDGHEYGAAQKSMYTSALPVRKAETEELPAAKEEEPQPSEQPVVEEKTVPVSDHEDLIPTVEDNEEPVVDETEEVGFEEVKFPLVEENDEIEEHDETETAVEPVESEPESEPEVPAEESVSYEEISNERKAHSVEQDTSAMRLRAAREAAEARKRTTAQQPVSEQRQRTTVRPRQTESSAEQRRAAQQRASAGNAARRAQSSDDIKNRGRR